MKNLKEILNESISLNSFNEVQKYFLYHVLGNISEGYTDLTEILNNFKEDTKDTYDDVASQLFDKFFPNKDYGFLERRKIK